MSDYIMGLRKLVGHRPLLQVGASVIVENERGEVLLQKRADNHCWGYAGGSVELDEPVEDAAARELLEETGLTADVDSSRRAVIEYPVAPKSRKQVVFFPGQVTGEPRPRPGETEQFRWVTAGELKDHLFPDTVQACQALL